MKKATLASIVTGLAMFGTSILPNNAEALKQIELTEINKTKNHQFNLPLRGRDGRTRQHLAQFGARIIGNEALMFYLTTANHKKEYSFKEKSVQVQFRYGIINPPDAYLIHPKGIGVQYTKQFAYIVPQMEQVSLVPFNGSREELVVKGLRGLLETSAWAAGIPFTEEILDTTISYFKEKKNKSHSNALKELKKDYIVTKIPNHVTNRVTGNETMRAYRINFDGHNLEGKIPMTLWARFNVPYLAKGAKLEDIMVKFSLQGRKSSRPKKKKHLVDEKAICLYVNKKINSERNDCRFEHIDLDGDRKKESIVKHNLSASQLYTDVIKTDNGKISHLFSYYGGATPEISNTKTKGHLDLFIVGQYRDKTVPTCVRPQNLPKVFNMIKWDGKKYKFSKERRKQRYLGKETQKSCSNIEIGKTIEIRSTFESNHKNAEIIFYERYGKNNRISDWKEFASRKRVNGHTHYPSMVELRNYGEGKEVIAEMNAKLEHPSSFLEVKVGVKKRGYVPCETKPEKLSIRSKSKVLKLKGCSKLKKQKRRR